MKNFWIAIDQLLNVLAGPWLNWWYFGGQGPWGHPDETISSVLGKYYYAGILDRSSWALALFRFLNRIETDHCQKSVEWNIGWTPYAIQVRIKKTPVKST